MTAHRVIISWCVRWCADDDDDDDGGGGGGGGGGGLLRDLGLHD
jgi:hypothetical protein